MNRVFNIITKSKEQSESWNTSGDISDIDDCHGCFVRFDDMLDYNQKANDPIFTRKYYNESDI